MLQRTTAIYHLWRDCMHLMFFDASPPQPSLLQGLLSITLRQHRKSVKHRHSLCLLATRPSSYLDVYAAHMYTHASIAGKHTHPSAVSNIFDATIIVRFMYVYVRVCEWLCSKWFIRVRPVPFTSSVMVRRARFRKVGFYLVGNKLVQDGGTRFHSYFSILVWQFPFSCLAMRGCLWVSVCARCDSVLLSTIRCVHLIKSSIAGSRMERNWYLKLLYPNASQASRCTRIRLAHARTPRGAFPLRLKALSRKLRCDMVEDLKKGFCLFVCKLAWLCSI